MIAVAILILAGFLIICGGHHTICFHDNDGNERGTSISLYDYADFTEILFGHKSYIIFSESVRNIKHSSIPRFQARFNVTFYKPHDSRIVGGKNLPLHALRLGCDLLYMLKAGGLQSHPIYPDSFDCRLPTAVHGVFSFEKHGTTYGGMMHIIKIDTTAD